MPGEWTPERRARAAENTRRTKPWLQSTGPRTPEGKAVSAQNGFRGAVRPKARAARRRGRAMMDAFEVAWRAVQREIRMVDAEIKKHGRDPDAES